MTSEPHESRAQVAPRESFVLRKPETIERLYLDFDGFFASVERQADRRLRGRQVGVVEHRMVQTADVPQRQDPSFRRGQKSQR